MESQLLVALDTPQRAAVHLLFITWLRTVTFMSSYDWQTFAKMKDNETACELLHRLTGDSCYHPRT